MILERGDILTYGQTIQEMKLQDIQAAVAQIITRSNFRCYRQYVNSKFPPGYAETFKIIQVKRRKTK